jgi:hypothetical protein
MLKDLCTMPVTDNRRRLIQWLLVRCSINPLKAVYSHTDSALYSALRLISNRVVDGSDARPWDLTVLQLLLDGSGSEYAFFHSLAEYGLPGSDLQSVASGSLECFQALPLYAGTITSVLMDLKGTCLFTAVSFCCCVCLSPFLSF